MRFYERKGLLTQPEKPPRGFRRYDSAIVDEIRFIKRAQALGFTLNRIQVLMNLRLTEYGACGKVKACAEETLSEIEARLKDLEAFRVALKTLIDACDNTVGAPLERCALIETLEAEGARP